MALLSPAEIKSCLGELNKWTYGNDAIYLSVTFDSYMEGIAFVNKLAEAAEKMNHHPDLTIGWCKVGVTLTSHDQGGVTKQCVDMAKIVNNIL